MSCPFVCTMNFDELRLIDLECGVEMRKKKGKTEKISKRTTGRFVSIFCLGFCFICNLSTEALNIRELHGVITSLMRHY